ncbi:MAG: DUF4394 domain-containing protein [Cytophagales bacterium]|nr:DUF4394 domain-containing protein [Armatimonadota bacterium]
MQFGADRLSRRNLVTVSAMVAAGAIFGFAAPKAQAQSQETITGLSQLNVAGQGTVSFLFNFSSASPSTYTSLSGLSNAVTEVTGVDAGFTLQSIDYRPTINPISLNGTLYALGTNGAALRLYTISTSGLNAGAVTSSLILNAGDDPAAAGTFVNPFAAANYDIDFNPAANALRIINDQGGNYRIGGANLVGGSTTSGLAFSDTPLSSTGIIGAAYTNNFGGAPSTLLYDISGTSLFTQAPPNSGALVPVGSGLGQPIPTPGGFDISGPTGLAYYGAGGNFYNVSLTTGTVGLVGFFGNVGSVRSIAAPIATAPEPGSLALAGIGLIGLIGGVARRRRK